jgi:hypothetical protein
MTAPELLRHLRQLGMDVRSDGSHLIVAPRRRITEELRCVIRENKPSLLIALAPRNAGAGETQSGTTKAVAPDSLSELRARERRRAQAVRMLAEDPAHRIAFVAGEEYRGQMVVMLAVRTPTAGTITGELVIDKGSWDPLVFTEMIGKFGGGPRSVRGRV